MAGKHWRRAYWVGCGVLAAAGVAGAAAVILVPVERLDAEGQLIGEMPPAFGVALFMAVLGLAGLVAGSVAAGVARWWRWTRDRRTR